jgi:hypothetical protein
MPRFVVLEHDHPYLHWDLMLEAGDVLWSWRLAAPPAAGERIASLRTPDHRKLYLDYEGPVSGDRGFVRRWDHGHYTLLHHSEAEVRVKLQGMRLVGTLCLEHREGADWQASYHQADQSL